MKLKGKKVLIPVEKIFNDLEFWYPYYRLKEEGAEVVVVGTGTADTYEGKSGTTTGVDTRADKVDTAGYDGIVIPGGYAPDYMRRYPAMVSMVKDMHDAGKPVAAICHAGWMLASADVLKGTRVTSVSAIRDDLINAGAEWVDEEVVVSGNIITSRKPDDLPAFLRTIIDMLA